MKRTNYEPETKYMEKYKGGRDFGFSQRNATREDLMLNSDQVSTQTTF